MARKWIQWSTKKLSAEEAERAVGQTQEVEIAGEEDLSEEEESS